MCIRFSLIPDDTPYRELFERLDTGFVQVTRLVRMPLLFVRRFTDIEGGGLQHIVKNLGSAGSADPLNQRATVGWKAIKTAERLVEPYMVRIETCSTFDSPAN